MSPRDNTYFTISLFNDDPVDGKARRRKPLFRATHVIVVDDVGTKVDPAAAAKLLPPSCGLRDKPCKLSVADIIATPETDAGRVNALLDGMVAQGLCPDGKDPGMKGVTRYVRLPVGRNTKAKYGPGGFACRLTDWHPAAALHDGPTGRAVGHRLASSRRDPGPGAKVHRENR